MIQVNRIYLIFNRLVTKKFLVDTSDLRIYKYSDIFPCGCCVSTLRKSSCINWRHVLKLILALLGDSDKVIHYIGSGGSCIIFSFCQLFSMFAHCFYDFRMLL